MIFWRLFYTFCKIGIVCFGGGYSMIALIQHEVVEDNAWLTAQEFTDIVATSQMTPGPVGINVATYSGYTAVVNAGYAEWIGVLCAFMTSFAVILLPFVLMLIVSKFFIHYKDNAKIKGILSIMRLAVIGLIAAAALLLITPENFGWEASSHYQLVVSVVICISVFFASYKFRVSPIILILISGLLGAVLYGLL